MALGALIIKEKLGTSDRETVEQIRENPYLQYFIGKLAYSNQAPFDPSMLVHFRERVDMNLVNRLNQKIVKNVLENQEGEEVKANKSESGNSKSEVRRRKAIKKQLQYIKRNLAHIKTVTSLPLNPLRITV
jgi:transposase, IS5 family